MRATYIARVLILLPKPFHFQRLPLMCVVCVRCGDDASTIYADRGLLFLEDSILVIYVMGFPRRNALVVIERSDSLETTMQCNCHGT